MKFEFNGQTWTDTRDKIVAQVYEYMALVEFKLEGVIMDGASVRMVKPGETTGNFVGWASLGGVALEVDSKLPLGLVRTQLTHKVVDLIPYHIVCDGVTVIGTYEEVFNKALELLKRYPITIKGGYARLLGLAIAMDTLTVLAPIYVDDNAYITGETFVNELYSEFARMTVENHA